jgi:hypothetical protein
MKATGEFSRFAAATRCEPGRFALRPFQTDPLPKKIQIPIWQGGLFACAPLVCKYIAASQVWRPACASLRDEQGHGNFG